MDQPVSFSSLPPELVSKICTDLDLKVKDLVALRLTSKAQGIHASATKFFAKRYLTDVLLLQNPYSLETFVKICQHPVFGPSIRRIQLSSACYYEDKFYDSVDPIREGEYARHTFLELLQRVSDRCDAELYKFEDALALLTQAFDYLAEYDHSFVLAVSTDEQKSLGSSKTFTSDMSSDCWYAEPYHALGLLLNAADQSGCNICKIEVQAASGYHLGNQCYQYSIKPDLLRSVSDFTFDLSVDPYGPYYHDLEMVQDLLSLAANLKSLHFHANIFASDYTEFGTLAQSISCLPLEELHLAEIHMPAGVMTDLLKGFGSTLRRLKISKCDVVGSWKQIVLSIQEHAVQLEKLQFEGTGRAWVDGFMPIGGFKGMAEIHLEMAKLLQLRDVLRFHEYAHDSSDEE